MPGETILVVEDEPSVARGLEYGLKAEGFTVLMAENGKKALELARGAAAGSDHQLAFVNALCTSVLSTRHAVVLADLLDHDPADLGLPGLSIDTDLRWRIVTALAAAGAAGPAAAPTGAPHAPQNVTPSANCAPHFAQNAMPLSPFAESIEL